MQIILNLKSNHLEMSQTFIRKSKNNTKKKTEIFALVQKKRKLKESFKLNFRKKTQKEKENRRKKERRVKIMMYQKRKLKSKKQKKKIFRLQFKILKNLKANQSNVIK